MPDSEPYRNGRVPPDTALNETSNPYAEVLDARRPPELVRYDLNMDPYANVVPQPDRNVLEPDAADWETGPRTRPRWMVVVSVVLILVLFLPAMAQVWSHLFH